MQKHLLLNELEKKNGMEPRWSNNSKSEREITRGKEQQLFMTIV